VVIPPSRRSALLAGTAAQTAAAIWMLQWGHALVAHGPVERDRQDLWLGMTWIDSAKFLAIAYLLLVPAMLYLGRSLTSVVDRVVRWVTAGALVVRSFGGLLRVEPGFDAAGVLTMTVPVPATRYPEQSDAFALHARLQAELAAIPGVRGGGGGGARPPRGAGGPPGGRGAAGRPPRGRGGRPPPRAPGAGPRPPPAACPPAR
jgi:hypothetical protein